MKTTQVAAEVGRRWKAAAPEVKAFYAREAMRDRDRYYRVKTKWLLIFLVIILSMKSSSTSFLTFHQNLCSLLESIVGYLDYGYEDD
jgi:hypothetical protein